MRRSSVTTSRLADVNGSYGLPQQGRATRHTWAEQCGREFDGVVSTGRQPGDTYPAMSKDCAFCGQPRRLSREHIWPNGFLGRGNFGLKYSAKARKAFEGDLIIKDVCEVCNNGPLSVLDSYACELYDANFAHFPEHLTTVQFTYDYGKLTRWLLKIAFNSARAQGHPDVDLLGQYRAAILAEGDNCPIYANVYLALVGPGTLAFGAGRPDQTIYPHAGRSGPVVVPNVNGYQYVSTRLVMINGYFFTLVLSRTPQMPVAEVSDLMRRLPGEPLALSGRMALMTTLNANQALMGARDWPRGSKARK